MLTKIKLFLSFLLHFQHYRHVRARPCMWAPRNETNKDCYMQERQRAKTSQIWETLSTLWMSLFNARGTFFQSAAAAAAMREAEANERNESISTGGKDKTLVIYFFLDVFQRIFLAHLFLFLHFTFNIHPYSKTKMSTMNMALIFYGLLITLRNWKHVQIGYQRNEFRWALFLRRQVRQKKYGAFESFRSKNDVRCTANASQARATQGKMEWRHLCCYWNKRSERKKRIWNYRCHHHFLGKRKKIRRKLFILMLANFEVLRVQWHIEWGKMQLFAHLTYCVRGKHISASFTILWDNVSNDNFFRSLYPHYQDAHYLSRGVLRASQLYWRLPWH